MEVIAEGQKHYLQLYLVSRQCLESDFGQLLYLVTAMIWSVSRYEKNVFPKSHVYVYRATKYKATEKNTEEGVFR